MQVIFFLVYKRFKVSIDIQLDSLCLFFNGKTMTEMTEPRFFSSFSFDLSQYCS